jgi:hypothetical protein
MEWERPSKIRQFAWSAELNRSDPARQKTEVARNSFENRMLSTGGCYACGRRESTAPTALPSEKFASWVAKDRDFQAKFEIRGGSAKQKLILF